MNTLRKLGTWMTLTSALTSIPTMASSPQMDRFIGEYRPAREDCFILPVSPLNPTTLRNLSTGTLRAEWIQKVSIRKDSLGLKKIFINDRTEGYELLSEKSETFSILPASASGAENSPALAQRTLIHESDISDDSISQRSVVQLDSSYMSVKNSFSPQTQIAQEFKLTALKGGDLQLLQRSEELNFPKGCGQPGSPACTLQWTDTGMTQCRLHRE